VKIQDQIIEYQTQISVLLILVLVFNHSLERMDLTIMRDHLVEDQILHKEQRPQDKSKILVERATRPLLRNAPQELSLHQRRNDHLVVQHRHRDLQKVRPKKALLVVLSLTILGLKDLLPDLMVEALVEDKKIRIFVSNVCLTAGVFFCLRNCVPHY
jgi:hypothetical protein